MKIKKLIAGASIGTALFVGAAASPAMAAEATPAAAQGSFSSVIGQGQPTFDSRVFTTSGRTVTVVLSNCTDNTAGKNPGTKTLTSVSLQLFVGSPGESSAFGSPVSHKCGTYSLGTPASGTPVYFEIHAINGDTSADRTNFLDADVSATY